MVALGLLAGLFLAACSSSIASPVPYPTGQIFLTPYWTPTPSPTSPENNSMEEQAVVDERSTPTIPPPPTPTPFVYEVKKGDTMLGIAFQHGVSLDQLQAANPDVDPRMMSVGTKLVIPIGEGNGEGTPSVLPTPTPLPVDLGAPRCFPSTEGGLWCLAEVHNDQGQALENLFAWFSLTGPEGEDLGSQQVAAPLNLLPAGESMPLIAYFSPSVTGTLSAAVPHAALLSALAVADGEARYLPAQVQIDHQQITPYGLSADVAGKVIYPPATPRPEPTPQAEGTAQPESSQALDANLVWLAVIAYDESGEPVGVRKWVAPENLAPGSSLPFEVTVFSLGPPIAKVKALVEARHQ